MCFFPCCWTPPILQRCRGGGSSWSAGIHRVAWAFLHTPGTTSVPRKKEWRSDRRCVGQCVCICKCIYYIYIWYMMYVYRYNIIDMYILHMHMMFISNVYLHVYVYVFLHMHICTYLHIISYSRHITTSFCRHPQTLDTRQLAKKHLGEIHPRCFTEHSTADSFLMSFLGNMIRKAFAFNMIPFRCILQIEMRNKTTTKQKTHQETYRYRKVRPNLGHDESMKAYEQTTSETCVTSKQHIHRKPLQTHTKKLCFLAFFKVIPYQISLSCKKYPNHNIH